MFAADRDLGDSDDEEQSKSGGRLGGGKSMTWLTQSDIHGLPKASNPLLDQVIRSASQDTPEVTQVRGV
jgi:hypothetical protein